MNDSFSWSAVIIGVLANVIYGGLILALRLTRIQVERSHPGAKRISLAIICIGALVGNVVLYEFAGVWFPLFSTLILAIAFFALWSHLMEFWGVGLIGADRHIGTGMKLRSEP